MAYNILSRQIRKLMQKWYSQKKAEAIAIKTQRKNGNLQEWSLKLSEQWQQYSQYTPAQRAIIRYAKQTGKDPNDLEYIDWKVKKIFSEYL